MLNRHFSAALPVLERHASTMWRGTTQPWHTAQPWLLEALGDWPADADRPLAEHLLLVHLPQLGAEALWLRWASVERQ